MLQLSSVNVERITETSLTTNFSNEDTVSRIVLVVDRNKNPAGINPGTAKTLLAQ